MKSNANKNLGMSAPCPGSPSLTAPMNTGACVRHYHWRLNSTVSHLVRALRMTYISRDELSKSGDCEFHSRYTF
jgi:hypothetical protein